ncbi:hypothetical protein ACFSZS_18595 [Seohaeicola zhoushanensis]
MTGEGRALSKAKGAGFIAQVWLENDGDAASQAEAALRWPDQPRGIRSFTAQGREIVHVIGKKAAAGFTACAPGQLVIASVEVVVAGAARSMARNACATPAASPLARRA